MKRVLALSLAALVLVCFALPVFAQDGAVTYQGNAQSYIFEPGSDFSPTDLFPDLKGVMPGDTVTQTITFKNESDNTVTVYLRALGAQEGSETFLSQLTLRVSVAERATELFHAAAHETAQLTDPVCLGTLEAGGEVELVLELAVPTELSDAFQGQTGLLEWEFTVEEQLPAEDDPTWGLILDNFKLIFFIILAAVYATVCTVILVLRKKKNLTEKEEEDPGKTA